MKKIIILFVWSLSAALISSCDKMNDIHQKYVDMGDRVYLGKTDSLIGFSGVGRVKLVWYANADPKLETTVIYWNTRRDSIEKPFKREQNGVQKDSVIIEGLPEGLNFFELVNKNQRGERSLMTSVEVRSYGDTYASGLKARPVTKMLCTGFNPTTQSSTIKIVWGDVPMGSVNTKLAYKKRTTGEVVVLDVSGTETETTLTDVGNRLEHPDDILYVSSVYAPDGLIDPVESLNRNEQLVHYLATGKRIENTVYEGSETTFTFTYTHQEKSLRLVNTTGNRVYDCSRVAELSPTTTGTSFRMNLSDDHKVGVNGYYVEINEISDAESTSTYDPTTRNFDMRYTVKTNGGSYTIEETLVPKTTPFEKEAAKPFGDLRAIIPGDNNTEILPFSYAFDGIHYPALDHGWLPNGVSESPSVTFDLMKKMKLTRLVLWPAARNVTEVFDYFNVMKFEIWGIAELDESKLSNAAYWDDAADPAGTFKEDWVYLGFHEVERLDKRNATNQEILNRAIDGNHFIIPESAGPVRYIRFYNRDNQYSNPGYFWIGELSFFGYVQE